MADNKMTPAQKIDYVAMHIGGYIENGWTLEQLSELLDLYCTEIKYTYELKIYPRICEDILHLAEWYIS